MLRPAQYPRQRLVSSSALLPSLVFRLQNVNAPRFADIFTTSSRQRAHLETFRISREHPLRPIVRAHYLNHSIRVGTSPGVLVQRGGKSVVRTNDVEDIHPQLRKQNTRTVHP